MVPGSMVGCDYCHTLPLAQQPARKHYRTVFKDLSQSSRRRDREMGSTGCPNFAASETKRTQLEAAAAAAEAAAPKKKKGRKPGVENNRYFFPSLQVRTYEVCRREMLHVMGQGTRGHILARVQKREREAPTVAAAGSDRVEDNRGKKRRKQVKDVAVTMDEEVKLTIKQQDRTASHLGRDVGGDATSGAGGGQPTNRSAAHSECRGEGEDSAGGEREGCGGREGVGKALLFGVHYE
jgi:hypothetical protein